MEKQDLIRVIKDVFPLIPVPKVLAREATPYYDEYSYVELFFLGRPWNAFSMRDLWEVYEGDPSAITVFMSGEALAYYLPGFMIITITENEEADFLVDSLIESLTPNGNGRLSKLKPAFNSRQANAIAGFLTHLLEEHLGEFEQSGLVKAIEYWNQSIKGVGDK